MDKLKKFNLISQFILIGINLFILIYIIIIREYLKFLSIHDLNLLCNNKNNESFKVMTLRDNLN